MKKPWNLYTLDQIADIVNHASAQIRGRWVPLRPTRYYGFVNDLKLAWLVFTRKADAFEWPESQ
jgi:hypothetical protein